MNGLTQGKAFVGCQCTLANSAGATSGERWIGAQDRRVQGEETQTDGRPLTERIAQVYIRFPLSTNHTRPGDPAWIRHALLLLIAYDGWCSRSAIRGFAPQHRARAGGPLDRQFRPALAERRLDLSKSQISVV